MTPELKRSISFLNQLRGTIEKLEQQRNEAEQKLSAMQHAYAHMQDALDACEIASGWTPGDTPLPVHIYNLRQQSLKGHAS